LIFQKNYFTHRQNTPCITLQNPISINKTIT